eukprot:m.890972 g.890972  ORF g.890972 m.890972 type:complete len:191 (+) comp23652_c1_seq34:192-764(+)
MATLDRPDGLDQELPRAVLQRLIKNVVPDGVGISRDAKIAFGVAAQIFVSYVTATSNDIAQAAKRKTLSAKDVLEAMEVMGFPDFVDPLKASLEEYKKEQQDKKDKAKRTKAEKEAAKSKIKAEATLDGHLDQDGRKRKDPNAGEIAKESFTENDSEHVNKSARIDGDDAASKNTDAAGDASMDDVEPTS